MITLNFLIVCLVIVFILVSLYWEVVGPTYTFLIAIATLGVTGVLTPKEMLDGFANEQVWVIILLLLIGSIIQETGAVENLFDRLFRNARSYKGFLSRMTIIISTFSAFLNNTPLVAVMMPYVNSWCKRNDISPSKFLLPLSYAAILGGCATLIGTSTNLIVNGLLIDQHIIPGYPSLNIFDFAWVGVPMIIIGFFYLLFFGDKMIPSIIKPEHEKNINSREYIVEARIPARSHFIGKTVEQSGLANLKGVFILELRRGAIRVTNLSLKIAFEKDDIIVLAGDIDNITELMRVKSGLTFPDIGMLSKKKKREVIEVVVSHKSSLINKKVKSVHFRSHYDAAIISIHRNGVKLDANWGDMVLKSGDVLLLYAGDKFFEFSRTTKDFYFISKVKDFVKLEPYKVGILIGGMVIAIILAAFHVISLFMGLIILITLSLAFKITTPKSLPKGVDYDLGLIIVMSLALGTAMIKTGLASVVANSLINIFMPMGKIGLLFGIYFITTILAAYITNKAAVGIIFPIAMTIAASLNLDPKPFVLTVAYASAANFLTPIGYQTNLMVYGPGGYSFKDFLKVGTPLTIIYMLVTVLVLNLVYLT